MSLGYSRSMRAVMLEVPEQLLADRRRFGHDKRDEVWEGVLHMVPSPGTGHQRRARQLLFALAGIAERRGLEVLYETSVFDPPEGLNNYRVPDLVMVDPTYVSDRGIEGHTILAVEILSPNDESRDKLPFYARVGVREVWLFDPKKHTVEMFQARDGVSVKVEPPLRSVLGLELETVDGVLRIRDGAIVDDI